MDPFNDVATRKPTSAPDVTESPERPSHDTISNETLSHTTLLKECLDAALDFLSTSSNERLLGVFFLLFIGTYLILGRLGLLLIGAALGVILHATWEGTASTNGNGNLEAPKRRRELALEVSRRLLDWPLRATLTTGDDGKDSNTIAAPEDLSLAELEYSTFRPATAGALRLLTDAVLQDYVKYWYDPILPGESVFPGSCRRTLTHFVTNISSHLSRKRTEDTFLQFLTNSSSIIIVFLNELAAAFAASGSSEAEAQTIVEQYLTDAPDSSLANVLSKEQQRKKLNMISDDILSNYLDPKAYRCSPVRDFLREIFARVVLESTVISLSRPEFINDWLIYLLQDGESEIMHAIDAGVEGARKQGVNVSRSSEDSKPITPEPAAERISQAADSQVDAATEEAMREAKRLSAMIASQDVRNTPPPSISQDVLKEEAISSNTNEKNGYLAESLSNDPVTNGQENTTISDKRASVISMRREEAPQPVSLHGAQVLVDDDGAGYEKGHIKSRPTWDYLLQIEPTSTRSTGWMVFRKYADFQSVHEMMETVARLNQIQSFSEKFPKLPAWKGKTRQDLARELERYLQEAMKHEALVETERMRRFVEKEGGNSESSVVPKPGFSFPKQSALENMGKGVLGALTNAPKGVTGVFGGAGHNRKPTNTSEIPSQQPKDTSTPSIVAKSSDQPVSKTSDGSNSPPLASPAASTLEISQGEGSISSGSGVRTSISLTSSEQDKSVLESTLVQSESRVSTESHRIVTKEQTKTAPGLTSELSSSDSALDDVSESTPQSTRRQQSPITTDETQIAVELIFAVINELYTLSSAWNIRRTLLNAAKSYILRPGNPTLETIRTLLQESMIESHTSDEALCEYLKKLRENALPTEAELKDWLPSPTDEEKEQLRIKARRLFVQRGIPQALTSVMGAAASREALEKIFDSLQVESVAQGFIFSVLLQGLRVLAL
ncbi:uncharacterized protein N7483_004698 [Penicillium malachiteum]|uniref:uncharacterized protein n=1 Tax=Penicillium malachiteum TaxID=1324776 RepID=UPI002547352A|nr:uncharacterized protein N7483_004698 [Penicillium malachiteum]KAJ5730190.1 hypothetical protein N7483_004698 [Penicillium malachiteum]